MHGNIWAHTFEPVQNRKQSCKLELQGQGFVVNHSLCHLLLFFPPLVHSWLCANHGRSNRRNANGGNKIGGNFADPCPKLLCPAPRVPWPRPPAGKRGGGSRPGLGMRQHVGHARGNCSLALVKFTNAVRTCSRRIKILPCSLTTQTRHAAARAIFFDNLGNPGKHRHRRLSNAVMLSFVVRPQDLTVSLEPANQT